MDLKSIYLNKEFGFWVVLPHLYGRRRIFSLIKERSLLPFDEVPRDFEHGELIADKGQYETLVHSAIEEMNKGKIHKLVTSRKVPLKFDWQECQHIWDEWTEKFDNAFLFCIHHPRWGFWMGASPELLVYRKEEQIKTMALAGSKDVKDHSQWTDKEFQEHQVVVDMITETLKKVEVHNIHLEDIQEMEYRQVKHLYTAISGHYSGSWEVLVREMHPTPALCGWPIKESKEWLYQNEGYNRGLYGGVLQFSEGDEDWSIVLLRCIQITDDYGFGYVGGGIMPNSIPENEWNETMWKLKAFIFANDENHQ